MSSSDYTAYKRLEREMCSYCPNATNKYGNRDRLYNNARRYTEFKKFATIQTGTSENYGVLMYFGIPVSDYLGNCYGTIPECQLYGEIIEKYHSLAILVNSISQLYSEFAQGNYALIGTILTFDTYLYLTSQFANLAAPTGTGVPFWDDYETIRLALMHTIQGMQQGIMLYTQYNELHTQYMAAKELADILIDPERLRNYIAEFNARMRLSHGYFGGHTITMRKAEVKPEYAAYIRKYGIPHNCVFDMEKLAEFI